MSQVDYLHFFNNMCGNVIQFFLLYFIISIFYVPAVYKVMRGRFQTYKVFVFSFFFFNFLNESLYRGKHILFSRLKKKLRYLQEWNNFKLFLFYYILGKLCFC